VYPFATSGDTEPTAGGAIATGIAEKLAAGGSIRVLPPAPGAVRTQFLANAVSQNADYYVTGFVTTIGREVSLIAQLVSTHSGAVVWSNTWLISTLDDATSHATAIRDALLHHIGRTVASDETPAPAPLVTAKPLAEPSGHVADLFGALEHRPRRRGKATPTANPSASAKPSTTLLPATSLPIPSPTPSALSTRVPAVAATPSPTNDLAASESSMPIRHIVVLAVGGDAESTARLHASDALAHAFEHAGYDVRRSSVSAADAHRRAPSLCSDDATADGLASATLHVNDRLIAEFALTMYDCQGRALSLDAARRPALGRLGFIPVVDDLVAGAVSAAVRRSPPPASRATPAAGS
jgi:hypothetical protein